MPVDQDQRPSFFQGQYLGPEDLTAIVEYGRIQHARELLGGHTWGIAIGLQLVEKPSAAGNNQVDVFLTPGYAWDGFGRAIVVLSPYKVPAQLFQDIVYDAAIDDPGKSGDSAAGRPVKVWLRYSESANRPPAAGFEVCDGAGQMSRVQESFALEIGEFLNLSDQRDPVSVGGKVVDAAQALIAFDPAAPQIHDASIPQQALPEDDAQALWLVPAGYVRWLPGQSANQAGAFQQKTAKDLPRSEAARQYIGVVAGAVEAAGQNVQVKLRGSAPSGVASDDLLWVEGKLRVEDDLNLFGGKLSFLNSAGKDDGVPLLLQRTQQTDPSTLQSLTSLQIEIGKDKNGNNMLSVGPLDSSSKFAPVFNVLDNGKAGVGTAKPRNQLGIRAAGQWEELLSFEDPAGNTKWHLNQNPGGGNSGLNFAETGVADFRLFIQAGGKIGIGTSTPSSRLHVDDILGIRQKYLYLSGDKGWSSLTYNAFHDAQNQNWQFPDSSRPAVTIEMDDQQGAGGRFQVWSTTLGAKSAWIQRFGIDGESGNVFMAHQGGNVGIGTASPAARLQVTGGDILWGNNCRLQQDQGGSIELGGDNATPGAGTPYIDFHFAGLTQDFNTRIINDADNQLSLFAGSTRVTGNLSVLGARTYLLGLDGANVHWIMAGGTQEGVHNALGLFFAGGNNNAFHTGPGWLKGFLIDHPLEPDKYLQHATLEGAEAAVFYRGEARLDKGKTTVRLPGYFEALVRKEGRTVLLTPIAEGNDPISLLAATEVKRGSFSVICADEKNMNQRFYWEVKAVRSDVAELEVVYEKRKVKS
jgi:hypothetical protein